MERLINRRQQGDLGEASAIEWLTRQGATVFLPVGHSPDADLVADIDGRLLRVQVKTSTCRTGSGYQVMIATHGGNQSWTGLTRRFARARCDALFVLVGDGRRWFIPSLEIDATRGLTLGSEKYSEFEIERTSPIDPLVHSPEEAPVESLETRGSAGAWRAGPACKAGALALSEFESHLPHFPKPGSGIIGRTRISANHQVTIPRGPFAHAGLSAGDRIRVEAYADGQVQLSPIARRAGARQPG